MYAPITIISLSFLLVGAISCDGPLFPCPLKGKVVGFCGPSYRPGDIPKGFKANGGTVSPALPGDPSTGFSTWSCDELHQAESYCCESVSAKKNGAAGAGHSCLRSELVGLPGGGGGGAGLGGLAK